MTSTGTGQGNSSDEEDNEIALAPRLSRASRNLLLGNVDSADESDVLPNNATSDDAITNKDYRREPVATVCNGPTTRTHRVNGSTSPRDTATQELPGSEILKQQTEPLYTNLTLKKSGADIDLFKQPEDHEEYEYIGPRKSKQDLNLAVNDDDGDDKSDSSDGFNVDDKEDCCNVNVRKSKQKINLAVDDDQEQYQYVGVRKSKEDMQLATSTKNPEDTDSGTDVDKLFINWVQTPPSQQAKLNEVAHPNRPQPLTEEDVIRNSSMHDGGSSVTLSSGESKSTLWSTCSRETDIGNSGKSSPLFMSRMDLMEVLQKQSGEETPVRVAMSTPINSAATLPFRMLEAKLAALSDESDADGPIMSLNGRRTNKHAAKTAPILPDQQETSAKQEETKTILSPVVALKSTSALNDQPNPDDDSEEEKTSTSSGISHDSQELFARYSGNIRPVIRDQQKHADNVDLGQTSSSSVCFNRSVSVAMFHKDNRTPTTDTENEIEDEMEMKYQKQKKRRQKYSSSSSNNAINSESSTDSYSVASLYPSTQTSTNLDSSEYNSMTLTESTDSGDYSITDTSFPEFTSSEPAAAVTGLSRQDLSPAFIHHVKRLLSLPNLRSEWKDQLTHILVAEDTQADGTDIEGVAESAEDVARIVSQIIQGLMQTSGMSGLRILAETASVVATTGSDIESSFSVASSGGYLPSSDSSSHTASVQESDEVLQNVVDIDSASSVSRLPTLLQLIEKIEQREQQMARGGVGSVPDLAAISHMLAQYESSSSGSESDSDPGNMEAAAAMFVFNLVLTVVDRSLHEGQQADDVHYIPEVNNTEPHVEEDSCAGVGSLPAMFQSPSQLLAKHEQQQSLDPATMDAQSWNTRQANIRKHCSNAAVLPSNILRTRLADRIAARPSLLEEKYLSLPPPAKDMMAANSKSEGKLTIDCQDGTSIFKPEESKSVASIPLGSPGEVQAPQNSTPPHSMNEKKYQSVATWLVKSPEQNEIFRSEKDFDLGSVDIMKVEAATEDSSDGNPRPHKHQVIESQKNEADNDSLARKPSRAFSITRNPSYCEKEDLSKDGSNLQSTDQATNYQGEQIVTTNDVRNNNIPAPDIKSAVNEYFLTDRTFVAPTRTQIVQPVITGDHPKGLVVNGVNLDYLGLKSPYYQPHEKAKTAPKPASPSLAARYLSDLQNDQMTVSDLKTKTQPGYSSHKAPCSLPFSDASRFRGDASCNHDVMTLSMLKEPQRSPHSSPRTSPCSSPRGQSVSVPFTATATSENARFREGSPTDVRSLLVEKEMFESRLRALQMENSTLKAENKLNNEKLSRAQARCQYLEAQLRASEDDSSTLRHRHDNELSALTIRSRDRTMRDRQDLQDQVVRLTRDLEVTRAQNALLEKQLEAVRSRPAPGTDRSKVIDSFKVEVAMLKEELKKARELLTDCDLARRQEGDKRKEAAIQVIRLTEVTALLRQQLENTGSGSVADRQVQSLERRLKITEDRLHQERADRAAKLSEVEGRLITENATLQSLQSERLQYSTELDKYREIIDDAKSERCQFVETYENQVSNLTREKHATAARVKDLEDINAALTAENDALKHGLHQPQDRASTPNNNQQCLEAQLESVRSELRGCQGELHQALRTQDSADTRLRSLAAQLEAKTSALGEALGAIEALEGSGRGRGDEWRQAKIDTLHVELDQLQAQLRQKTRLMDQLASSEGDYQVEQQALRTNLAAVNREMAMKNQQLKSASLELAREQDKTAKLTSDLEQREKLLSEDIAGLVHKGALTSSLYSDAPSSPRTVLTQAEMRVRMVEYEKETLNADIEKANGAISSLVRENSELSARVLELKQELVSERALLSQAAADKAELEQKQRVLHEEHAAAVRQRALLEQDLVRHETTTNQVIERLEQEAKAANQEWGEKYSSLDTDGKRLAVELGTSQRLLEAREKEIDVLRDTVFRQKQEINALQRRAAILGEENSVCRDDVDKLTKELTVKLKQHAASLETNKSITTDRSSLLQQKYDVEKSAGQVKLDLQRVTLERDELRRKCSLCEERLQSTEQQLLDHRTKVVSLETSAQYEAQASVTMATEASEARGLVERVNAELRGMMAEQEGGDNSGLFEEKSTKRDLRGELTLALHQIEVIRQDYTAYTTNLTAERNTVDMLKTKCRGEEDRCCHLEDQAKLQAAELDTLRGHLVDTKRTVDTLRADKQTLFSEVQDLTRQLTHKEETITSLELRCEQTVDSVHQERTSERVQSSQEKHQLQDQLDRARLELEQTQDTLSQKERQLEVYYRTSRDLHNETRAKSEVETQLSQAQTDLSALNLRITALTADNSRLQETLKNTLDNLESSRETVASLREQLREQREESTAEIRALRTAHTELQHRTDTERGDLQEKHSQTQASLRAAEASLAASTETKESLQENVRQLGASVDTLKAQVSEETTARRLAEQRADGLQGQLGDSNAKKATAGEKIADLQSQLSRLESELSIEREKYRKMKRDFLETQNSSTSQERQLQTLTMQIAELQAECASLQSQLENQKQNLTGKNKRLVLELKQQTEVHDKERSKLVYESQQLSSDLERLRDQLAAKSRECLRLQEAQLGTEAELRDATRSARTATDALRGHEGERGTLETRNMELELLLAKLRSKDSDDASFETTRLEVTRMLSELSQRMQSQMDQQRTTDGEARARDTKKMDDLRSKLVGVEASLSQEQAMHIVTRTQASSLEEDNQRLRQQLQIVRRRLAHSGDSSGTERTKSRLEEINEIIARSQTRAQQLLASGAYTDGKLGVTGAQAGRRSMSPSDHR